MNPDIITQTGYWNALVWGSLLGLLIVVIYALLSRNEKKEQVDTFLCGEEVEYATPGQGFFYGFERTLGPLFGWGERFHSEIVNEYVAYALLFGFLLALAFVAAYILGWGAI